MAMLAKDLRCRSRPRALRTWAASFYKQDLGDISGQTLVNALISYCTISGVRDAKLIKCDLAGSRFSPKDLEDMLGVTLTIDCFTFDGLEMNELALSAVLFLLTRTKGNDEMRAKMLAAIPERLRLSFERQFEAIGR